MKKFLKLILCGASLVLALAVFATMAGEAVVAEGYGIKVSGTVYGMLGGDEPNGVLITALVFFILGLVAILGTGALLLLKKSSLYAFIASLAACALLIAGGISYFCVATGDLSSFSLGAGAILSGIFCLLSGLCAGSIGALTLLKI